MKITRISDISGVQQTMELDVTKEQINAHLNGTLLQNAFPNLNAGEREFIKTGITPAEWKAIFPIEE